MTDGGGNPVLHRRNDSPSRGLIPLHLNSRPISGLAAIVARGGSEPANEPQTGLFDSNAWEARVAVRSSCRLVGLHDRVN
jgi:hypothetical protein